MSVAPPAVCFFPLICCVDKAAYPHFNIFPPCVQALVPLAEDVPRLKRTRRSREELHNEVALRLPTTIPVSPEHLTSTDRVPGQPYGLMIAPKQQELFEEPVSLSSTPTVSPLRLRRRVPSLNQLNVRNSSPPRSRISPASDSFPFIETMLSQSKDETAEPLEVVPTALTRPQSLSVRPTTPKRRQSALITQRIMALNATMESPEPVFNRPIRRSTSSLPISLVSYKSLST